MLSKTKPTNIFVHSIVCHTMCSIDCLRAILLVYVYFKSVCNIFRSKDWWFSDKEMCENFLNRKSQSKNISLTFSNYFFKSIITAEFSFYFFKCSCMQPFSFGWILCGINFESECIRSDSVSDPRYIVAKAMLLCLRTIQFGCYGRIYASRVSKFLVFLIANGFGID